MMLELGPGLLALLGSVVTSVGGVVVLLLTQRGQFRKAQLARENARQEAAEQAAKIALDQQRRLDATHDAIAADAKKKEDALHEIHALVNSRLSRALGEIEELKRVIEELKRIIADFGAKGGSIV